MHHQQGKERVSHHQRKRSSSSGLVLPLPPQPLSRTSFSYSRQGPVSPPQAVVAVAVRRHKIIAPHSSLARAIVMGNDMSGEHGNVDMANSRDVNARHAASASGSSRARHTASTSSSSPSRDYQHPRPISNLTVLLNQHNIGDSVPVSGSPNRSRVRSSSSTSSRHVDEADSASGPAPAPTGTLGSSAPNIMFRLGSLLPPSQFARQHSASTRLHSERVRRCMSSWELGTLAPPSGSPYAYMLHKKEELEVSMRKKLVALRDAEPDNQWCKHEAFTSEAQQTSVSGDARHYQDIEGSSTTSSKTQRECANEMRNRRRAQHAKAVVDDLCSVVADLFIAESKLLDPRNYGVTNTNEFATASTKTLERDQILKTVHSFVASLPLRYALGADTPSEVLLHMRLMAAARSDETKAVLHIHNLEDDCNWSITVAAASARNNHSLRLVTISCHDATGLLEYISKLLATSGSRVLDADVMLSTDGIVLDRFVVEMTGRLRLDMMVNLIEAFLREALKGKRVPESEGSNPSSAENNNGQINNLTSVTDARGPLYFKPLAKSGPREYHHTREQEIQSAVPLSEVLASNSQANLSGFAFPKLRKLHSMPTSLSIQAGSPDFSRVRLQMRHEAVEHSGSQCQEQPRPDIRSMRQRRPLVDRPASSDLDRAIEDSVDDLNALDYLTVPGMDSSAGAHAESRVVPLIPFEELMLIETIGTGRVSTIYRAAWQRGNIAAGAGAVQMVALKVAMVNAMTGDTSHVDELRREADIAARLEHSNICDLVGVAADPQCFCLAYEYCEGGSLLSLLSDPTRFYEYLPIALDIAQGMAFLHKKCVIHRDLKPSNILLTRDHRAKIADFGMSINNHGQELTAETGTYRYMAPEVIRHESYSSNADVYSFGICLWQLITREIPFAVMTPIQAAYAVAEGHRPEIPMSTPRRLQEIIRSCWNQDSHRRPSFTYVAMALADYAKMAFSPANVGTLTLQIANEMLATVEGNSTVNVDFTTPVAPPLSIPFQPTTTYFDLDFSRNDSSGNVGLEIE